ncbi:ABC-type transport auxiliary lipoprotein family protein [Silvimonas iriomotensis]|uniref:ABC-type transport auxiliary lipoprotein component domain-containing protein n=1 Tax=Silvimonas iriomotensis TaxID=449662 RepID=A0ABQ2PD13_9NEIS|nr:ABC-type transport auxiliary lipoprotein family protein [Silvimonas iriomotensis]GGP23253.1 hypothetical protein GCM10010970_32530 [Silvimonas iriomotensis]
MIRAPYLLIAPLFALLAACSSPPPAESRYELDANRPESATTAPRFADTLKVMLPNAVAGLDGTRFIYRETAQRYARDPYRGYTSPIPLFVSDRMTDWLNRSNLFTHVIPGRSPWGTRYVLESDIRAFYIDLRPDQPRTAQVRLGARVRDTETNTFVYDGEVAGAARVADPANGDSFAAAQSQALGEALTQLETALRKVQIPAQ